MQSWIESIRISKFINIDMGFFKKIPIHMGILSIILLECTNLNI